MAVFASRQGGTMVANWSLADVEGAKANWFDFHLSLFVWGNAPTPCHRIDLQQSLLEVEPPSFTARWHNPPGICPQVITPYSVRETFKVGCATGEHRAAPCWGRADSRS